MKKEFGVLMLSAILLSGCGAARPITDTVQVDDSPREQATIQPKHGTGLKKKEPDHVLMKLYAKDSGAALYVKGKEKDFAWNFPGDTGTAPQMFYTDLTGDGKEEAAVIIHIGKGTGLDNYEIHVVNAGDLSEINVQTYEDIVASRIESQVSKNGDGTLAIKVQVQEKELNFTYGFDPAPHYNQEELAFGGITIYSVEDQTIRLRLPGSVGVSPTYVCDFDITYKYDSINSRFIADQIEVTPVEG
ncbi:hypothetical protein [Paenibacillus tengchongensis]|uniref:hypothetical protein n=1 Tax=Paenibacillus tengchongensis TaxID=2608684 RepID=UPI00124D7808|nr:hypothetical protein [Paenibacillus tengchongensis]